MKKKIKLGFLALSLGAVVATLAVTTSSGSLFNRSDAGTDDVWNHYSAVAATTKNRGIKEYWVSCSTHQVQFTAPATGHIEDKGAPSQGFINRLEVNDTRVEKQLGHIDFEDATDINMFSFAVGSGSIVEDNTATSGSHVLKVVANSGGSFKFTLTKTVLDKLFADPSVQAIQFDAKADATNINFRRRTSLNPSIPTELTNITYEINQTNRGGLTTEWKTFYFERNFYEQVCQNSTLDWAMIISDNNPANGNIYFDNFRVTTNTTSSMQYLGFEGGNLEKVNDIDYRVFGYARTEAAFPTSVVSMDLYVTTNESSSFSMEFSTDIVSEGRRAIKIIHNDTKGVSIYLPKEYAINAGGKGIMFDVYWDGTGTGREEINFAAQVGKNAIVANHNLYSKCWSTAYLPLDKCTASGNYFEILKLAGTQCNGTFIIDNIRPYLAVEGFENFGVATSTANVEISANIAPDSEFKMGSNRRDKNDHVFYINGNGATSGAVSEEFYTQGTQSFKYTHTGTKTDFNLYMNKLFYGANLGDEGVSIDVLTFDGNIKKFCGNQEVVADGEWHTYTITKEMMHSLRTPTGTNEWYCMAFGAACSAGTYYFDNLVFLGI